MKSEADNLKTLKRLADWELEIEITMMFSKKIGGVVHTVSIVDPFEKVEAIGQDITLQRAQHEALKDLQALYEIVDSTDESGNQVYTYLQKRL